MAATQVDSVHVQEPTPPTAVRKRKRRVPATGAAEDCHACRKREAKCDRRRPYCSQCLEMGKECSGYRTTLTWGVGVASRGKLRGMSLPVAKSAQGQTADGGDEKPKASISTTTTTAASTTSPSTQKSSPPQNHIIGEGSKKKPRLTPLKSSSLNTSNTTSFPQTDSNPMTAGVPPTNGHWRVPSFQAHRQRVGHPENGLRILQDNGRPDLFPLHTATGVSFGNPAWNVPSTGPHYPASPWEGYSDVSTDPSSGFPPTPHAMDPTMHSYANSFVPFATPYQPINIPTTGIPSLPVQPSKVEELPEDASNHNNIGFVPTATTTLGQTSDPIKTDPTLAASDSFFFGTDVHTTDADSFLLHDEDFPYPTSTNPTTQNALLPRLDPPLKFYHLPTRMQYLVDFYSSAICPVLVTFDGPSNPYRSHIMPMVLSSPGLQNALAALATNNMRMKCLKQVPRLDSASASSSAKTVIAAAIGKPTPEEQHYKTRSIDLLNRQLANPAAARDDSVLATLLILCLFHVCDSGFSKFKTQLAGVQKLLRMRGRASPSGTATAGAPQSDFVGWIEMFFAWFDVMTAAVNDRETEIQGESLDLMDLSCNLGVLEQFSGCEGRLFKLIARLGRLNLLSQGRPVKELDEAGKASLTAPPPPPPPRRKATAVKPAASMDFYSLHGDEVALEPLSWPSSSSPSSSSPESAPSPDTASAAGTGTGIHGPRAAFWREWHDLRQRLHSWQLPSPPPPHPPSSTHSHTHAPSPSEAEAQALGHRHLLHISSSFRAAALLYTERLARPALPSSSPMLQRHVHEALFHIREIGVNSCVTKFMLWPLFVVGTECVGEAERELVRERCVEIQMESGFYNNVGGLEVLERVWREVDVLEAEAAREVGVGGCGGVGGMGMEEGEGLGKGVGCGVQAFRWRSAMDRVDGEYIVI